MGAQTQSREQDGRAGAEAELEPVAEVNEVRLVGRLSAAPASRALPSGDVVWSFRVVIERPAPRRRPPGARSRRDVDALECSAWLARVQRTVSSWRAGDVVEVHGRLRRRFYRSGGVPLSRVDVEVRRARVIRRATSG